MAGPPEELQTIWSLPASALPPADSFLGAMPLSPALLQSYKGHEALLRYRAKHPPHCYERFDQARLCWLSILEPVACKKALENYRPCAREMRKAKLAPLDEAEQRRRRELTAAAKALASAGPAVDG